MLHVTIIPRIRQSSPKLHYPIRPILQSDLNLAPAPKPPFWRRVLRKVKIVATVYATISTLLFTAWLVVPAIADSEASTRGDSWTIIRPLTDACQTYGGFEFGNRLYSCAYVGQLGGTLKMNPTLSIEERQKRLRTLLPPWIWGNHIPP